MSSANRTTSISPQAIFRRHTIDCIRNNKRPEADEQKERSAGVAVALGNQAIDQGKRIVLREHLLKTSTNAAVATATG